MGGRRAAQEGGLDGTFNTSHHVPGTLLCMGLAAPVTMTIDGGNATVSFGQWKTAPPLDRFLYQPCLWLRGGYRAASPADLWGLGRLHAPGNLARHDHAVAVPDCGRVAFAV